jgi:hypothetical protein
MACVETSAQSLIASAELEAALFILTDAVSNTASELPDDIAEQAVASSTKVTKTAVTRAKRLLSLVNTTGYKQDECYSCSPPVNPSTLGD